MDKHSTVVNFLEKHFFAPEGMIYSSIDRENFSPPSDQLFFDAIPESTFEKTNCREWHVHGFSRTEVATYENSGMTTGATMVASVLEYKRTGDSRVLERARRLFRGLQRICEVGASFEPGFITKYYGARFTYETSNDQCLYLVYGMDAYYELAQPEERSFIEKQIPAIASFWMRHNYTYSYFEHTNMVWPPLRFPALLMIAWKYSGNKTFKEEADRIMRENIDCVPEFAMIPRYRNRRFSDYEEKHNIRYFHGMADSVTMDTMHLTLLLRCDPQSEFAQQWQKGIETIWDEARRVITPDGKCYTLAFYQMDDDKTVQPYEDSPLPWAKTAWSTMIARAGLLGLPYMPWRNNQVSKLAELVLNSLGPTDMTYFEDLHGYPETHRFLERFLSGDTIANWLWAWELLQQNKTLADKNQTLQK